MVPRLVLRFSRGRTEWLLLMGVVSKICGTYMVDCEPVLPVLLLVHQPAAEKSKAITCKELNLNRVLKTMKWSVHFSQSVLSCWNLLFFNVCFLWTPPLLTSLFQPTCQSLSGQTITSFTSNDVHRILEDCSGLETVSVYSPNGNAYTDRHIFCVLVCLSHHHLWCTFVFSWDLCAWQRLLFFLFFIRSLLNFAFPHWWSSVSLTQ